MRRRSLWIAVSCILAVVGSLPVFSYGAAQASTGKILYTFTGGSDGGAPLSDLTLDAAGNLYGTTNIGGTGTACNGGCGTVFELEHSADGWKEQVLYSFQGGKDGFFPVTGVIFDGSDNLYGTTLAGGSGNGGTVFKLASNSHGGWTESVLYNFTGGSDGSQPNTDLVFDAQGDLFGTTSFGGNSCNNFGCGTVFELVPQSNGTWKESTVYEFAGAPDGAYPSTAVVLDSLGKIYGMTKFGGTGKCVTSDSSGCGMVYQLAPTSGGGWTETVIYDFARGGGSAVMPSGGLILDKANHLYGTTLEGGNGTGTVFELTQAQKGWEQRVLHRFYGNPDGIIPVGRVAMNAFGDLFGVTSGRLSKPAAGGVVFELQRSGMHDWRERILYSFGSDGDLPVAGVVSDSHGHLYGTTQFGGSGKCDLGCGVVYEVIP